MPHAVPYTCHEGHAGRVEPLHRPDQVLGGDARLADGSTHQAGAGDEDAPAQRAQQRAGSGGEGHSLAVPTREETARHASQPDHTPLQAPRFASARCCIHREPASLPASAQHCPPISGTHAPCGADDGQAHAEADAQGGPKVGGDVAEEEKQVGQVNLHTTGAVGRATEVVGDTARGGTQPLQGRGNAAAAAAAAARPARAPAALPAAGTAAAGGMAGPEWPSPHT